MAAAQRFCVAEERSGHCAAMDRHRLYVWGGYVTIEENEVYLPHDEIWEYDTENGLWQMHLTDGDLPPSMSGSCGACLDGRLYIFGGYDDKGYSNQLYYADLRPGTGGFTWKEVKHFKGQPPTARDKLSCWVYKHQTHVWFQVWEHSCQSRHRQQCHSSGLALIAVANALTIQIARLINHI